MKAARDRPRKPSLRLKARIPRKGRVRKLRAEEGPPVGVAFARLRHPGHPVHPVHMGLDPILEQPPELGQERHQGDEAEADAKARPQLLARAPEGVGHGQDADEDEDGGVGAQGERGDEQQDDEADQGEPPAGESLAVQHEDEAGVHEGGAGFALRHDDEHRDADDGGHQEEILPLAQLEVLTAHHRGQQERGRNLRYFSGLELDRPQFEPRMGPLYVLGYEYDQDEQGADGQVHRHGRALPDPGRDDEEDEAGESEGREHPHELLAAAEVPVDDGGRVLGVDGRVDVHPADEHQQDVHRDQFPVDGLFQAALMGVLADHLPNPS